VKQARSSYFPQVAASASVSNTWLSENDYRQGRNSALEQTFNAGAAQASAGTFTSQFPVMSALGAYARALADGLAARRSVDNDTAAYSAAFEVQWLLFDGFEREYRYAASKFAHLAQEAGLAEARRLLLEQVAQSYYAACLAREDMAIAKADIEFNQKQLKDAQARRRVGTGSLSDVLNFEVRVNQARATLHARERDYAVSLIGLAALMGLPESVMPEDAELAPLPEETAEELTPPEAEPLVALAIEQRPDVVQSEWTAESAEASAKAARGPFFPTVSASASRSAAVQEDWYGTDDFATTVGIHMSYEFFTGGRNRAALAEAYSRKRETEHLLANAELLAAQDVRNAVEGVVTAQKQLWLQRANASFVQRNRDLVEKEYNAGQASLVRLNEAQRDLISAQGQLAAARVALRQAWHTLRTATAETLELYGLDADD
jgi:outer membrane protein TolC